MKRRVQNIVIFIFYLTTAKAKVIPGINKDNFSGIYASSYGEITISIHNKILTGTYQYYDKWNNKSHQFIDANVFFITGKSQDAINYLITTSYPGYDKKIKGKLYLIDGLKKLKIILSEVPDGGYDDFDFRKNSFENVFPLKELLKLTEIRIIKSSNAQLYDYSDSVFIPKKSYLVKGDIVGILGWKKNFIQISYRSPITNKRNNYWIKDNDLYSILSYD